VAPDGERVLFLRAAAADDPSTALWVLDPASGRERCVADPAALDVDAAALTPQERLRRERVRESAGGIVAYATDRAVRMVTFAISGQLYTADLVEPAVHRLPLPDPVTDPRLDPEGRRIAFASGGGLHVTGVGDAASTRLLEPEGPDVTWGLPEFVAAEEMDRVRGFWWAPDGEALAVTRVDVGPVQRWHLQDPVDPDQPPVEVAYPAAGTANADVRLAIVAVDGGGGRDPVWVEWDRGAFPYLADVVWGPDGPLTLVTQSRDQKTLRLYAADPETGATEVLREDHDPHWVELVPGVPRWLPDGRVVLTVDAEDTRSLAIGPTVVTPPGLQVRAVAGVADDAVIVLASEEEPTEVDVWRVPLDGQEPACISERGGVASAAVGGATVVLAQRSLARPGAVVTARGPSGAAFVRTLAATAPLEVRVEILRLGARDLRAALVLPSAWREGDALLPVLMQPYGGPHHQRVLASRDAFLVDQWFADQGFAVLVVDGRGTPGRGPAWERAVAGDLATPVLEDQVDALQAAAEARPVLDLGRVGILGWSFGGFLAALAVLRRPDVFHVAVAGAPVTDQRLYDTHYTERYLGHPDQEPGAYRHNSLLDDAPSLRRPLLLMHGLSDDNVVAAHTLRLSRALTEAGRPHSVLPLPGVTHMASQESVAANLLLLQLAFFRDALLPTPRH